MQGPAVKLLPRRSGVFENGSEENRERLAYVGHVKEENERGWLIAECGTFVPKACYEEVERKWEEETDND